MNILFYTLGCKVNQAESGGMAALLESRGHTTVSPGERVDAVIINTCTVTATADKKARNAIRKMGESYPDALICVCGCLTQLSDISEVGRVDVLGGSSGKAAFALSIEESFESRRKISVLSDISPGFEALPAAAYDRRTRLFLKIQDGCQCRCSYCIIPDARGPCRSCPEEEALRSARDAADAGCREIVLTGIEISSYTPSLTGLIKRVCAELPGVRVRIGSLNPATVTERFCAELAGLGGLCPHFHLSVQSGCDGILKAMNRRYTAADMRRAVGLLRSGWENPAISADIIAGFPGETDAQWRETLGFLEETRFSSLHVFPYSRRKGTPAASFPGQLTAAVKRARAAQAEAVGRSGRERYLRSRIGDTVEVLFETASDGVWTGHAPQYLQVAVSAEGELRGKILPVKLTGIRDGLWEGEL